MTITYQTETFDQFFADADALIKDHWEEVATFPDIRKLHVAQENYRNTEKQGGVLVVTLRIDGALQGYIVSIIGKNLHSVETTVAIQDAYYVAPQYRGYWEGLREMWETEARARGASMATARQKIADGKVVAPDALFLRAGYEKGEISWYKRL